MQETALIHGFINADSISESCNYDQNKLIDYLSSINLHVYSNSPSFLQEKYGNERVKKESSLTGIRVDHAKPNWIPAWLHRNLIADET